MVCWPFALGPVVRQYIMAGVHVAEEAAHLMVAGRQRGMGSARDALQGHTSNDLPSSHQTLPPKGSPTSQ